MENSGNKSEVNKMVVPEKERQKYRVMSRQKKSSGKKMELLIPFSVYVPRFAIALFRKAFHLDYIFLVNFFMRNCFFFYFSFFSFCGKCERKREKVRDKEQKNQT